MTSKQRLLVCCLGILLWGSAHAERDWYRYENAYFEAFSDDSPRNVLKTLEELELFRAAVVQVANIRIPGDAPKVRVVVFASQTEFQSLIGSIYISGLATSIDGVHYLVLSDKGTPAWEERTVRHEYTHVLLNYKNFPYPLWFQEGFAELMSTTEFRNRNREFSVGKYTGRGKFTNQSANWNELLADDFDFDEISGLGDRSDVYLFSWLLTHHFMLADGFKNTDELASYLTRLAQGQKSLAAFEAAVGEPPEQYCSKVLRKYTKRKVDFVTYDFRPELLDLEFERSDASIDDIGPLIEKIKDSRNKT